VLSINKNMLPFESVFSGFNVLPTAEPPANLDAPEHLNPPERTTRNGDDLGIFGKAGNISGAGVFELKDRRLTIATQPHTSDFNPTHWDNAPRALQEVKGDFSFEVTIDPPSQGKGWTCPNLMIADSEKRIYFRAGPIFDGSRTYFNAFLKVNTQYSYMPWIGGIFDHERPIRVRLKREGVKFTVATKGEGREWFECAPFLVSGCPETLQVGVLSLNVSDQMATAGFEDPVLRVGDGN
jgi:regulation of enolase protein 1 (concanavalin A-like superfamily)